jgi:predicted dinucleotide-binding enzyme
VVLLAVPAAKVGDLIARNAGQLDGKIIFDATNNISAPVKNAFAVLEQYAPNARL